MKLTITTTLFAILAITSAAPHTKRQAATGVTLGPIPFEIVNATTTTTKLKTRQEIRFLDRRQAPSADQPSMFVNGEVVPYQNTGAGSGMGSKKAKAKRQAPSADQPSMSVNGQVVPFSNTGAGSGMGSKLKARQETPFLDRRQAPSADQPSMSVNGQVVPFSNTGAGTGMGSKKAKRQTGIDADQPVMSVNGQVVPYKNTGAGSGMGS
ncbi:uncharacterized protein AB675_10866 [Cyphellophora attinorum]|uniref:Uncharacterized protein n=1 Tax=Cyphellophora attinorum TaxID=1664694 RepID=A0A0N1HA49_9EURO|nr:uncharacterized protein AB675_10866 [Phialophora attinorum]KPI40763.1 hypothetical protein AB675_10866 [Phialophora attinorum]